MAGQRLTRIKVSAGRPSNIQAKKTGPPWERPSGEEIVKKLINRPEDFVPEMLEREIYQPDKQDETYTRHAQPTEKRKSQQAKKGDFERVEA